jgi:hypothetical protein
MASPALDSFNTFVDGLSINAANKAAAKTRGGQLYQASVREAVAHVVLHIDAELAAATDPDDIRIRQFLDSPGAVTSTPRTSLRCSHSSLTLSRCGVWRWARSSPPIRQLARGASSTTTSRVSIPCPCATA